MYRFRSIAAEIRYSARLLAMLLLGLLSACLVEPEGRSPGADPKLGGNFAPLDDKQHAAVVAKYGGEYRHQPLSDMLRRVLDEVTAVSQQPSRKYRVTVLNSPLVNAFALPGGSIYVTRGLLALANDSSEVAAVLAHEIAHVISQHGILRQEKADATKIGKRIVDEVLGDSTSTRVAIVANDIRFAEFSRDQELQADTLGIRMIGRAGYDPFAAARFLSAMEGFRNLKRLERRNGLPGFLASHPSTPRRIEFAERNARFFGAPGTGATDRAGYLAGIDGMLFGDSPQEGFVRGDAFIHVGLGITFRATANDVITNQPDAVLIASSQDVATRFDAVVVRGGIALDDYLKSGWINGLDPKSVATRTINGLASATGKAQTEEWRFAITAIRVGSQVYRFITAMPRNQPQSANPHHKIPRSFRTLSALEKRQHRPLKIAIVKAGPGDSQATIAAKMRGTSRPAELLRLLNRIEKGTPIAPSQKLKVVAEG